jgi:N-acetylglucosaminyl-diphospho-decaprenol L-rhamnosyltransferase
MITHPGADGVSRSDPAPVTAVILNFKNYEETTGCVLSLLKQDYASLHCVIVDNASPNDALSQLTNAFGSDPRITILAAPLNGGYAAGNNMGARWAIVQHQPKYILIINPDVRMADTSTIASLVAFADSQEDAGAVGPKVILPSGFVQGPYDRPSIALSTIQFLIPPLWLMLRNRHQRVFRSAASPRRCFWTIGACMLLRAHSFAEVNMFDEATFMESEEPILAERFSRVGKYFYYVPSATVMHRHTRSEKRRHSLASCTYYFRAYRGHSKVAISVLELSARLYEIVYLPLQRHFDKAVFGGKSLE